MITLEKTAVFDDLQLGQFLSDSILHSHLAEGTINSDHSKRIIFLNEDSVAGIHKALVDETGPAWKHILYNCGKLLGSRIIHNFDKTLHREKKTILGEIPLGDFISFLEEYFPSHGWGKVNVKLNYAESHGLVLVEMVNSFFESAITGSEEHLDHLVCGILQSFFVHVSGHDVECVQIASPSTGDDLCVFVITGEKRIQDIESNIEEGESSGKILEKLLK